MFTNLAPQPADKILQLVGMFRADPRSDKIDLGVGVYKDATGLTPVMRAVKAAEKSLWEAETTKSYTSLAGEPAFQAAMAALILGDAVASDRIAAAATPGGTGAIRQALDLVRMATPSATVWVSDPTWPNHLSILKYLGIKTRLYRYFDAESCGVDFRGLMADLAGAQAGDVVLLHGCCHNPTGANLTLPEWTEVARLLEKSGAVPLIDIAYQGFGDGLEPDAAGTRLIASRLPKLETHDKVRIYYEVAEDFDGFEPGAMWDDTKLGFSKFLRWERFAMVTDVEWIRHTMQFFSFFMPGEFKTFHRAEADAARQWVSEPETVSA